MVGGEEIVADFETLDVRKCMSADNVNRAREVLTSQTGARSKKGWQGGDDAIECRPDIRHIRSLTVSGIGDQFEWYPHRTQ